MVDRPARTNVLVVRETGLPGDEQPPMRLARDAIVSGEEFGNWAIRACRTSSLPYGVARSGSSSPSRSRKIESLT